jgi:hypothetical protein
MNAIRPARWNVLESVNFLELLLLLAAWARQRERGSIPHAAEKG